MGLGGWERRTAGLTGVAWLILEPVVAPADANPDAKRGALIPSSSQACKKPTFSHRYHPRPGFALRLSKCQQV